MSPRSRQRDLRRQRQVRVIARIAYALLAIAFIGIITVTVWAATRAPAPVAIEIDTSEPVMVEVADTIKQSLANQGFTVQISDNGEEDIVVEKVQDDADAKNITMGVTARAVPADQFPNVESLGVVTRIPLLLLGRGPEGTYASPADLVGKRIQIGDSAAVTVETAEQILAEYGVTETNATFQRDKLSVAKQMLASGESDAMFILDSPDSGALGDLLASGRVSFVPFPDGRALAGKLGSVFLGTMPKGAYSIKDQIPSSDLEVITLPVTVVANDSISPSAAFAIAKGLQARFGHGDVMSDPGEFPATSDLLPNDEASTEYYQSKTVPWQYQWLPPVLADLLIPLALAGTIFLIVASIYQVLLPEAYSLWTGIVQPRRERRRAQRHHHHHEDEDADGSDSRDPTPAPPMAS